MTRAVSDNTAGAIGAGLDKSPQSFSAFTQESAGYSRQVFQKNLNNGISDGAALGLPNTVIDGQADSPSKAATTDSPMTVAQEIVKELKEMGLDEKTWGYLTEIIGAMPRSNEDFPRGIEELNKLALEHQGEPEFRKAAEAFNEACCRLGHKTPFTLTADGTFSYHNPKQGSPSFGADGQCHIE